MRKGNAERNTLETEIKVSLNLDGTGIKNIDTGILFLNHMLEQLASHGYFDLDIKAVSKDKDPHHVVEDVALSLGQAFANALGDKKGIKRYGYTIVPMDEALALTSIDISGRPFCGFDVPLPEEKVNDLETILVKHFFTSFATTSKITLHIKLLNGEDTHHKIESVFKSFARALRIACSIDTEHPDIVPSTKGVI
ncbi:MAG: imidazoleglycerol-phosphate dehydratase [Candidatus Melainabacteria bacterium GWF2_37_15]|nr:MAG: imidazoleglycerol-phosphate dehydratase [Candidatus Melainabacteria bacterium GWF2_37_15]